MTIDEMNYYFAKFPNAHVVRLGMTFGEALEAMKQGKCVRQSWWDKNLWVRLSENKELFEYHSFGTFSSYFFKTREMCANDWEVVEEKAVQPDVISPYTGSFQWAMRQAIEGRRIRRRCWPKDTHSFISEGLLYYKGPSFTALHAMSSGEVGATNWEISQ